MRVFMTFAKLLLVCALVILPTRSYGFALNQQQMDRVMKKKQPTAKQLAERRQRAAKLIQEREKARVKAAKAAKDAEERAQREKEMNLRKGIFLTICAAVIGIFLNW